MGARVGMLLGLGLVLAAAPGVAIATRPSVSPVAQAPGYVGTGSDGSDSESEVTAKFDMTIAANVSLSGGSDWYAYTMDNIRLFTDCSHARVNVPGSINTSFHRRRVSRRVHFTYRSHGVSMRGYFFGALGLPQVRATARVARPGCHDVVSFTAAWHKPKH